MLEVHMGRLKEECHNPHQKYFDAGDGCPRTHHQTVAVVLASRHGELDGWSYLSMARDAWK